MESNGPDAEISLDIGDEYVSQKSMSEDETLDEKETIDSTPERSLSPNHEQQSNALENTDNVIDLDLNYDDEYEDEPQKGSKQERERKVSSNSLNQGATLMEQATAISSESEGEEDLNQLHAYTSNISRDIPKDEVEYHSYNRQISQDDADDNPKKDSAASEDGELEDLEDGELKSDSDDSEIAVIRGSTGLSPEHASQFPNVASQINFDPTKRPPILCPTQGKARNFVNTNVKASERSPNVGICKFFSRGSCTWGEGCKFYHPPEEQRQHWQQKFHMQRPLLSSNSPSTYVGVTRVLPTVNLCKPVPLLSLSNTPPPPVAPLLNANNTRSAPIETAWERGLRQAREIKQAKQRQMSDGDPSTKDDDGSATARRDSLSPPSSYGQNSIGKTNRAQAAASSRIPSLIDSIRENEGLSKSSSSNFSYNRTDVRKFTTSRRTRSRSHTSGSNSDEDSHGRRRLKSQVSPVKPANRPTLNSNTTSDPWARGRRHSSPRSSISGSQRRSSRHSGASPVSSGGERSTPTYPSDDEREHRRRRSSRNKRERDKDSRRRHKRDSSSSASDVSPSSSRSPSHSLVRSPSSVQKYPQEHKPQHSPSEKQGRKDYGNTTLQSLLANSEAACRTGDLSSFKIPKKKDTHARDLTTPDDNDRTFRRRKRSPLDPNKFFEPNEADAPAAYRLDRKCNTPPAKRHRKQSSSSISEPDSDSSTSRSSSKKRRRGNRVAIIKPNKPAKSDLDIQAHGKIETANEIPVSPVAISSDEDDHGKLTKQSKPKEPQREVTSIANVCQIHNGSIDTSSSSPTTGSAHSMEDKSPVTPQSADVAESQSAQGEEKKRRQELLRQLRSVEEAIAKKRKKINNKGDNNPAEAPKV
ncbi:zinc finger CCCH domain-containing protein 18 [Ditylenchus destructor]|nr:zinc finger CCCH domain-containing protein 18 [Ditylenchus destructor]